MLINHQLHPSQETHSKSVSPAVDGDIIPWPLPTMKRSWISSTVLVAATVSSPL
jgi:hypothetical protein